jgi:hypothetical protein
MEKNETTSMIHSEDCKGYKMNTSSVTQKERWGNKTREDVRRGKFSL